MVLGGTVQSVQNSRKGPGTGRCLLGCIHVTITSRANVISQFTESAPPTVLSVANIAEDIVRVSGDVSLQIIQGK